MSERRELETRLVFNGVDAEGHRLHPAVDVEELAERVRGEAFDARELGRFRRWTHGNRTRRLGPKEGVDPRRIEQTGWGVIFAERADPALRQALEPLLVHRRAQATAHHADRYRELSAADGYRAGESKLRFLARHGVGPGPADPDRLPYYLLLVGGPEEIPFSFQFQLDVQYAVGRVAFDRLDDYARYAESVVATELRRHLPPRKVVLFGVRDEGDRATERTHDLLVQPLADGLAQTGRGWQVERVFERQATHRRLGRLLGGEETPSLLFSGTHGLGYPAGHPQQRERQGALVCQRPAAPQPDGSHGFTSFVADDLVADCRPAGLIAFTFACYSAGTPRTNGFRHRGDDERELVADRPFVARLPQRLLAHPNGGALALIGHVDRAWTCSFRWAGTGRQIEVFASTLRRLLAGHPVGSAMEYFNQRYAELECELGQMREQMAAGIEPDSVDLVGLWTARNDARTYIVLGDPAVRLPAAAGAEEAG